MKLWSIEYDEKNDDVPKIFCKNNEVHTDIEIIYRQQIFNCFYLTHRDFKKKIENIEFDIFASTYKELYILIFPQKKVKHQIEYLIDLLNLFDIAN